MQKYCTTVFWIRCLIAFNSLGNETKGTTSSLCARTGRGLIDSLSTLCKDSCMLKQLNITRWLWCQIKIIIIPSRDRPLIVKLKDKWTLGRSPNLHFEGRLKWKNLSSSKFTDRSYFAFLRIILMNCKLIRWLVIATPMVQATFLEPKLFFFSLLQYYLANFGLVIRWCRSYSFSNHLLASHNHNH